MSSHAHSNAATIEASADEVWRAIDVDFLEVAAWGPGVISSGPNPATPDGFNGSAHGGRVCEVEGLGATVERIVAYDGDLRTLTYSVEAEGFPPFIEALENTWTVRSDDSGRAVVETTIDVDISDTMSDAEAQAIVEAMASGPGTAVVNLKAHIEGASAPQ